MQLVTRNLTEKQARFVEAYVNGRNITGAAIGAGYSEVTASQIGSALLRVPHVQAAVQAGVRHALALDAPLARRVLVDLAQDAHMNPKIRLEAAKTLLDRAGPVAPRPTTDKSTEHQALHEMSIEQLRALADKLEAELADRAMPVAPLEPVDPANSAQSDSEPAAPLGGLLE
jgi:phage terminase small subunit